MLRNIFFIAIFLGTVTIVNGQNNNTEVRTQNGFSNAQKKASSNSEENKTISSSEQRLQTSNEKEASETPKKKEKHNSTAVPEPKMGIKSRHKTSSEENSRKSNNQPD